MSYYNLDSIKNVKDLDNEEPILRMIIGNRSAGKTTALLIESLKNVQNDKQVVFCIEHRMKYRAVEKCMKMYWTFTPSMEKL